MEKDLLIANIDGMLKTIEIIEEMKGISNKENTSSFIMEYSTLLTKWEYDDIHVKNDKDMFQYISIKCKEYIKTLC